MKSHCPECGAGKNKDGSFTLPKDWLTRTRCKACDKRHEKAMIKLGQQWAKEEQDAMFERLVNG